ncbi:uncharacterized protein LOC126965145 [Leptidea sinapis]|uniref:uncharacterized protein LOC126965145 n=1 Tax=Leptidea sinapis TaxID=189913 RepID=UPI00213E7144|nr:uncharacterized protein LOC126965145 [Leptidea sinapis]
MKLTVSSVTTSLVSILFSVKYASSIFCYDCNSAFDPRCGEEFDHFNLGVVNCSLKDPIDHIPPMESTFCRVIKMDIYGKVRVVRKCGYVADDYKMNSCKRQTGTGELFVTYCSCNTDLCNSSSKCDRDLAILSILSLLAVYLFKTSF